MPLPKFKQSENGARSGATHYFDGVHGDVAALHARIERSFADHHFESPPESWAAARIEDSVRTVSRAAGVAGLAGALGLLFYVLI